MSVASTEEVRHFQMQAEIVGWVFPAKFDGKPWIDNYILLHVVHK